MSRIALLAAALAAALVGGCGGGDGEEGEERVAAGAFVSDLVHHVAAGRYAAAWEDLYPPHQKVATRAAYIRCEPLTPFPGRIQRLEVRRVWQEPVQISGNRRSTNSTAVRIRMTVRSAAPTPERFDSTFHVVDVDGRWRWFLPSVRYVAYREGRCLTDG